MSVFVIDVGTSSIRGNLYDKQAQVLFCHQIFHRPHFLLNGIVEQDPLIFKKIIIDLSLLAVQFCCTNNCCIEAISVTAQRSSVIAVDKNLEPLLNAIMWQDKRTVDYCKEFLEYDDFIFEKSGSHINPVFSATKMSWIHENEREVYDKADKLIVIADYILAFMTGVLCTDHTYGSRSLLMNIDTRKWDSSLLSVFKIAEDKLAPLIEPSSIVGNTTNDFHSLTGISAGTPVVSAGGDQQCAALGLGIIHTGDLEITLGTGAFAIASCDNKPKNLKDHVICGCSCIPHKYILESSIITCCSAFDWFNREFYNGCENNYSKIDDEIADTVPGANGVVVLPYFQGRATPDWNSEATATFHNVTLSTTKSDMARALLESICYEINCNIKTLEIYTGAFKRIKICGGLTKNAMFNQIQADIYEKTIQKYNNHEATALGAWISAMVSLKECESFESAFSIVRKNDIPIQFHPTVRSEYIQGKDKFKSIYQKIYN